MVGDQDLLKQSKANVLTPAFNPRPFSVIGVKGSMVTVKRGREIKCRNSSHCKLLKHAREDEYVAVDLDQQGLDTQGHPMDLFLKISVLQAHFCWLGDIEEIIVLGRKVLLGKR